MQHLFDNPISRQAVIEQLFGHHDIAAIAAEHGAGKDQILSAIDGNEGSAAGARLRQAVEMMRAAGMAAQGQAFPKQLDRVTDGGLEMIGLFVNPLMTTAMILGTPAPSLDETGRAIDPALSLARYASRIFRVLAVQHPQLEEALSNAAAALERA